MSCRRSHERPSAAARPRRRGRAPAPSPAAAAPPCSLPCSAAWPKRRHVRIAGGAGHALQATRSASVEIEPFFSATVAARGNIGRPCSGESSLTQISVITWRSTEPRLVAPRVALPVALHLQGVARSGPHSSRRNPLPISSTAPRYFESGGRSGATSVSNSDLCSRARCVSSYTSYSPSKSSQTRAPSFEPSALSSSRDDWTSERS